MKIKIRFNKRHGLITTLLACAFSIWMMVRSFGFPADQVMKIAWICLLFLAAIIIISAPIALVSRWLADRRK